MRLLGAMASKEAWSWRGAGVGEFRVSFWTREELA